MEYKVLITTAVSEQELNALGAAGWELVLVVPLRESTHFHLKRVRT